MRFTSGNIDSFQVFTTETTWIKLGGFRLSDGNECLLITWRCKKISDRVGFGESIVWVAIIIQKIGYSFDV